MCIDEMILDLDILEARAEAIHLSLYDLGALAGIHKSTISRARNGHTNLTTVNLVRLNAALMLYEDNLRKHLIGKEISDGERIGTKDDAG